MLTRYHISSAKCSNCIISIVISYCCAFASSSRSVFRLVVLPHDNVRDDEHDGLEEPQLVDEEDLPEGAGRPIPPAARLVALLQRTLVVVAVVAAPDVRLGDVADRRRRLHPLEQFVDRQDPRVVVVVRHDLLDEQPDALHRHLVAQRLRLHVDLHRRAVRLVGEAEVGVEQVVDVLRALHADDARVQVGARPARRRVGEPHDRDLPQAVVRLRRTLGRQTRLVDHVERAGPRVRLVTVERARATEQRRIVAEAALIQYRKVVVSARLLQRRPRAAHVPVGQVRLVDHRLVVLDEQVLPVYGRPVFRLTRPILPARRHLVSAHVQPMHGAVVGARPDDEQRDGDGATGGRVLEAVGKQVDQLLAHVTRHRVIEGEEDHLRRIAALQAARDLARLTVAVGQVAAVVARRHVFADDGAGERRHGDSEQQEDGHR